MDFHKRNMVIFISQDNYTIKRRGETGGRSGFCNIVTTVSYRCHGGVATVHRIPIQSIYCLEGCNSRGENHKHNVENKN